MRARYAAGVPVCPRARLYNCTNRTHTLTHAWKHRNNYQVLHLKKQCVLSSAPGRAHIRFLMSTNTLLPEIERRRITCSVTFILLAEERLCFTFVLKKKTFSVLLLQQLRRYGFHFHVDTQQCYMWQGARYLCSGVLNKRESYE